MNKKRKRTYARKAIKSKVKRVVTTGFIVYLATLVFVASCFADSKKNYESWS